VGVRLSRSGTLRSASSAADSLTDDRFLVWDFDGTYLDPATWPVFAEYPAARAGWMIGDSWKADVLGSRAVGLRAILVRSSHPEATPRCETLADVVSLIESS
jgi:ribonucleotide monophosphatase NagD (HAD superfamily)